jgi:hypothetical protein
MMLVGDDPASPFLAQTNGQAKAILRIRPEFSFRPAAEQGMRECDILSGGNLERDYLERPAALLKLKERRPRFSVRFDATHAIFGRRYIKHHDFLGMIDQDAVHVAGVHCPRPAPDEQADLFLI